MADENGLTVEYNRNDREAFLHHKCEKSDYIAAVACGAVGAIIDLFVGLPGESKLSKLTDKMTDEIVKKFAKLSGWNGNGDIASAIGHLERKYKVGYDARYAGDLGIGIEMSPANHHLKSWAHSPDLIGLFSSLLCQFTGKAVFASNGKIEIVQTAGEYQLLGGNIVQKLFCGTVNWIGHIMSDVAGSSGRRGHDGSGRGSGISMPFYELFQMFDFGNFKVGDASLTIAELSTKVFENGYDARFCATQAIPVVVCNLLTRLVWAMMRKFKSHWPLRECIPTIMHDDLRVMLLVSNSTLCAVNTAKAAILSGGNWVTFFTRINFPAWCTLLKLALREVLFRLHIYTIDVMPEIYRRATEEIKRYYTELQATDLERYKAETEKFIMISEKTDSISSEDELQVVLISMYDSLNIDLPWIGDFDHYMSDKTKHLVYS